MFMNNSNVHRDGFMGGSKVMHKGLKDVS